MRPVFLYDRNGNVAVIFGIAVSLLATAVGVAVDYSDLNRTRSELQGTADAAALAGAKALSLSLGQPSAMRIQSALDTADAFIRSRAPEVRKTITPSLEALTVSVELSLDKPLFFGGLLGHGTRPVGVTAIATYTAPVTACFIALGSSEPVGIRMQGSPRITAPKCGIWSNSASQTSITTQGNPRITGRKVCAVGGARNARSTPPIETGCKSAPDPFAGRIPTSKEDCVVYTPPPAGSKKDSPPPGCYSGGMSISGLEVTLQPGIYEFRDGPLSIDGSGSLRGEGVSLLFTGSNAVLDLQGSPRISLKAMTSGPLAGIAIAAATSTTSILTSTIQGSPDIEVAGSIYMPTQRLEMHGSPTLTFLGKQDKLVALSHVLHGSPDIIMRSDDSQEPANSLAELRLIK